MRGGVLGPTLRADIFLAILLMRSVSFQYFSMAAGPLEAMSWNTSFSSGSSFSSIIFFIRSGDFCSIFCIHRETMLTLAVYKAEQDQVMEQCY